MRLPNLLILLSLLFTVSAQNNIKTKCGTMHYLNQQIKDNPNLEFKLQEDEIKLQKWLDNHQKTTLMKKDEIITIPVVVHLIYSADSQNISDERIHRQIEALNTNFSGQSTGSMGAFHDSLKANTGIQFCLASRKPDGSFTTGIERRETNIDGFQDDRVKLYRKGGLDAWDPNKYLNIWVCNYNYSDGTDYVFSAYAKFPGAGINEFYGVVIRYGAVGLKDTGYYRGNGAILSHEIGHCFNLRHIWGDDGTACTGSDFCDDTPNQAGRTEGRNQGALTDNCSTTSPGIMYMNYMDYSDDVIYANFTPDQKERMLANFDSSIGPLYLLSKSDGCAPMLGVNNLSQNNAIEIYPNPTNGLIKLKIPQHVIHKEFSIIDMLGIEQLTGEFKQSNTDLDLTSLSAGIFFLRVKGSNSYYRIVKW